MNARVCGKGWGQRGAVGGHSFPPDQIGTGIHMYYTGLSSRRAAKHVKDTFDMKDADISPQTILNWVHRYTDAATKLTAQYKAQGGGKWWVRSEPFLLYDRMWWMVIDDITGYIFASQVDVSMTEIGAQEVFPETIGPQDLFLETIGAQEVFHKAIASAVEPCDEAVYLRARHEAWFSYRYLPEWAVRRVLQNILPDKRPVECVRGIPSSSLGPVVTKILTACENTRKRFERIKGKEDLQRYLAGWVLTSNLFTEHRELGGWTPGQAAGVKAPIVDWADVVRLDAKAYLPSTATERAVL